MKRTVLVLAALCVLKRKLAAWVQCSHLPCPLSRQGTAAAAHLHACFSKACSGTAPCTPRQQGKHTHTHVHTQTHTRAHTHVHTHAHTQTHTLHTHARIAQTARDGLRQLFYAACDAPLLSSSICTKYSFLLCFHIIIPAFFLAPTAARATIFWVCDRAGSISDEVMINFLWWGSS